MKAISDLIVIFDSKLKFYHHIYSKINKAYRPSMLGLMERNFGNLSEFAFVSLYKSLVRPHLEYAVNVWSPYRLAYIEDLEKVQMRATKLIHKIKKMPYAERLKRLKLPTMKYRRLRGDTIETFKVVHGF
jgi:ribonuclease P/MRP protein subunit RPP40